MRKDLKLEDWRAPDPQGPLDIPSEKTPFSKTDPSHLFQFGNELEKVIDRLEKAPPLLVSYSTFNLEREVLALFGVKDVHTNVECTQ